MNKNTFKKGQVWSYLTREEEESSRLVIIHIENINSQDIIHIKLNGIRLKNFTTNEVIADTIEHLPISLEMFRQSVLQLENNIKVELEEGYSTWRTAFNKGEAGIWSVNISEAISLIEQTCNI